MSRIEDAINMRCSPMMTSPSHVMIGHGLVDLDHVSLRGLEGCLSKWEFLSNIIN